MKNRMMVLLIILMLSTLSITFAETEEVTVTIPEFDVTVNGTLIDIEHSQYPIITYNGVAYFPMTSDYLDGIGLGLNFSTTEGLKLNVSNNVNPLEQMFLGATNKLGSQNKAQLAPFKVEVNGKSIDNNNEEYPVLLYKNITYFPMTWRFAVTEFGWTTGWSNDTGFSISIDGKITSSDNGSVETQEISASNTYTVKLNLIQENYAWMIDYTDSNNWLKYETDFELYDSEGNVITVTPENISINGELKSRPDSSGIIDYDILIKNVELTSNKVSIKAMHSDVDDFTESTYEGSFTLVNSNGTETTIATLETDFEYSKDIIAKVPEVNDIRENITTEYYSVPNDNDKYLLVNGNDNTSKYPDMKYLYMSSYRTINQGNGWQSAISLESNDILNNESNGMSLSNQYIILAFNADKELINYQMLYLDDETHQPIK